MPKGTAEQGETMSQQMENNLSEAESDGSESDNVSFDMELFNVTTASAAAAATSATKAGGGGESAAAKPPSRKRKAATDGASETAKVAKTDNGSVADAKGKTKRTAAKKKDAATDKDEGGGVEDLTLDDVQQTLRLIEQARKTAASGQAAVDVQGDDSNAEEFVPAMYKSKAEESAADAAPKTPAAASKGKAATPAAPRKRKPASNKQAEPKTNTTDTMAVREDENVHSGNVARELFPCRTASASLDDKLASLCGRVESLERILGFALSTTSIGNVSKTTASLPAVKVEKTDKPPASASPPVAVQVPVVAAAAKNNKAAKPAATAAKPKRPPAANRNSNAAASSKTAVAKAPPAAGKTAGKAAAAPSKKAAVVVEVEEDKDENDMSDASVGEGGEE